MKNLQEPTDQAKKDQSEDALGLLALLLLLSLLGGKK
jgi:hypothetical protein